MKNVSQSRKPVVWVVSYFFPPVNCIAAQRWGYILPYLQDLGWDVRVITLKGAGDLPLRMSEECIYYSGTHSSNDVHNPVSSESTDSDRPLPVKAFEWIRRLCNRRKLHLRSLDRSLFWALRVLKNKDEILTLFPHPDVVISSFGPAGTHLIGRKLSKITNAKWLVDFRDLGAMRPEGRAGFLVKLDDRIEQFLVRSADAFLTVSPFLAGFLQSAFNRRTFYLYNGWNHQSQTRTRTFQSPEGGYYYYAGAFYEHRIAAVILFLDIVLRHSTRPLIIRSLGPTWIDYKIQRISRELDVANKITWKPPSSNTIVREEAENAFANLLFEDLDRTQEWSRGNLTGKLFQLLTLSPPILAIGRTDSDIAYVLESTSKGILVETAKNGALIEDQLTQLWKAVPTNLPFFSKQHAAKKLDNLLKEYCFLDQELAP